MWDVFTRWLNLCNLCNLFTFSAVSLLTKGVPRSPMVLLHRGTSEPRGPNGASAPGDPPVISPVVSCFCTSHRRITSKSIVLRNVLNMFRLCAMFESCSKVCFCNGVAFYYSVLFMFKVVVVDLIIT